MGESVQLTCRATGQPPILYRWTFAVDGSSQDIVITNSAVLSLRNVTKADAGRYTCWASSAGMGARKSQKVEVLSASELAALEQLAAQTRIATYAGAAFAGLLVLSIIALLVYKRHRVHQQNRIREVDSSKKIS